MGRNVLRPQSHRCCSLSYMMEPSIYVGICSERRQLFWLELTLILTGRTLPDCWSSLGFEPKITTIDVFWFTSWSIPALFIGKRSVTFTFLNYSISNSSGTNHKTVGCQKTVPITNQFLTCSEFPWPRGLDSQHQFQGTGLVRTVVSISHCGCDDPGSIPGLDTQHTIFTPSHTKCDWEMRKLILFKYGLAPVGLDAYGAQVSTILTKVSNLPQSYMSRVAIK